MQGCSENSLRALAVQLASKLGVGCRVMLEGQLGAGKTTFAVSLLEALGVQQKLKGSPSFPIVYEYSYSHGKIAHIDFFRLRSEMEIEEVGIHTYFWDPKCITIAEWISLCPKFERSVLSDGINWKVKISFCDNQPDKRDLVIDRC
ncbi:MAG: tRNA (adenosine(37)-N6)-threonylcarbamoyltransferase complex ATPase subunit type 1 TsaE [Bdellovibrionota bacterium]